MLVISTDFGIEGPYVGQMKAVLHREAPEVPVIDLFSDLPPFLSWAAAYLLPAYADEFPAGTVMLCVVDPGVGGDRLPIAIKASGRWWVGPDNGLFEHVIRRGFEVEAYVVPMADDGPISATFHGRDVFAPFAAALALGEDPNPDDRIDVDDLNRPDWPDDLRAVVYNDRFGNAMTGIRAGRLPDEALIRLNDREIGAAETFANVPIGQPFWYANANGLIEIAVNQGRADEELGATVGVTFEVVEDG